MRKVILVLAVLGLAISAFANEPIWQDIGKENTHINTVLVDADNPQIIYFGSDKGVFGTEDAGKKWRNVLSLRGANRRVNFLCFKPQDKNSIYAATQNGLYFSFNQGQSWKRIFQGKNYLEKEATSIAVLPSAIYLGTRGGLFVSKDNGRSWHRGEGNLLGKNHILAFAYNPKEPDYLYVACADGVFKITDNGKFWERIFVASPAEDNHDNEEKSEDQDEEERFSDIRYISVDPNNLNFLYLATSSGVYLSQNKGKTWQRLSDYGLLSREINFLLVSPHAHLYAVTQSGIFVYKQEHWQELSLRLFVEKVNALAFDEAGNLYAAGDKGLFKTNLRDFSPAYTGNKNILSLYYKDEPNISEIQQAAIRYAEVEPEKIQKWRKQAAKKALLPEVSVGLDRNVTDLWHWEGGSTTKVDDDILRRGRDTIEWDINLSWDLGELIWNDDQASIDVRSRLMVQLRDDILDEVTKIYFERIRVKMELDNLSIEDRKKRFEKELRLQELTAYLDGLTGGYFSQQIKSANEG